MNKDLESFIGKLKTLPTSPGVLVRLVTLFQNPDRDIDEVAALIRQDPTLAAGVLQHANSGASSPEEPIGDVHDAIAWVGFGQVYQAALAKLAAQSLQVPKDSGLDPDQIWLHSAITGVCASAVARKVHENESMAFTAGLLHDIGKVVLSLADGNGYRNLTNAAGNGGLHLEQAETLFFGFGHAETGACLLQRWGLPAEVVKPVQFHHQIPQDKSLERISAVVSLGNVMAHASVSKSTVGQYASLEAVHAMGVLHLKEEDLTELLLDSQDEIKQLTGSLASA